MSGSLAPVGGPAVSFFLAGEEDLGELSAVDPTKDWRALKAGERAWILQTYLHLRGIGVPVELTGREPAAGVVVFHAKHKRQVYALRRKLGHAVLVGVRGDLHAPLIADVEVLQNGRLANGRDRVFVPHWPQPGLEPRDPLRGDRIERLAYKGLLNNLHPGFLTHEWRRELAELGVEWVADASEGTSAVTATGLAWNDYREVDLVLAVRPPGSSEHRFKPASKLVNAWLAGSPALLGPEYAYRELRRSELDYVEVASVREAANAIRTLKEKPGLYRAMVEHSRSRAAEFTIAALAERWRRLLLEEVHQVRPQRRLPLAVRRALHRLQHLATFNLRAR